MPAWICASCSELSASPGIALSSTAATRNASASGVVRVGSRINRWLGHRVAKPVVFLLACLPFVWLVWAAFSDQLGANPAEALIRSLGDWSLRFLVLVLAITQLRVMAGWSALARLRRVELLAHGDDRAHFRLQRQVEVWHLLLGSDQTLGHGALQVAWGAQRAIGW